MRWHVVRGLAGAEARLTRRLARYWVFGVLSLVVVVAFYLYYAFLHGLFSSYSASVGSINPRFLVAGLGLWGIVLFMVGLVFLGFDVRARDERERIVEVLDSRPVTNLELVAGRFLGILVMGWLAMVAAVTVIEIVGLLGRGLDWPIGEPLEPWSIVGFLVTMAIPAFTFTLGLVFLISLLTRHRLVTAAGILVVLVAYYVVYMTVVPFDVATVFDLSGAYTLNFASELISIFTPTGLLQRAAVLVAGLGLLALAAAVHPRPDGGGRKSWALAGGAMLLVAVVALGLLYGDALAQRHRREAWRAAHEAVAGAPAPDVTAVRGEVVIDPGRALALDLELEVAPPPGETLERALFSFNPGLEVESLTDAAGDTLAFSHEDGLLAVDLPLAAAATLRLRARGRPDPGFAYLDSSRPWSELSLWQGNMAILGYAPAIFDDGFVALMPGTRWLPAAGAAVGLDDPRRRTDYYEIDLTVEVPDGWRVAGPGRRRDAPAAGNGAAGNGARFRFAPGAPMPETALVAARYERRAVEVAGVELELLITPGHARNLEVFDDVAGEIRAWLEERFREAAELGLPYPYDGLTVVEVPAALQGFGGGWRMDTVMAPPGLLLLRESSLPTARFDVRFRDPEKFEDREGGLAQAKLDALFTFFENDFNGGNVFLGAARNFFLYQTSARGPGALGLDFVCHDLTNRLITDRQGFFSVHIFGDTAANQLLANAFLRFSSEPGGTFNDAMRGAITERPEVWDQALSVAIADMDPWQDPGRTVNVLVLKGDAMSRSLLDGLGRERVAELLATLRERAAGRDFTREDFVAAASDLGIDLEELLGDWLDSTELPGFVASEPRLYRLPDADGAPRYQLALHLRNGEAAPGLARLRYVLDAPGSDGGSGARAAWQESEPVRVAPGEAVELGLVLSKPPRELRVAPYLSLNRGPFTVALPSVDEEKTVDVEPFAGTRPSDWRPADATTILVDDLDPGFAVERDEEGSGLRLGARGQDATLDAGLPVGNGSRPPREWSRFTLSEAWGRYRHTLALTRAGQGRQRAVFTAALPRSGPWRLELHMPPENARRRWNLETFHVTVEDVSGSHDLQFDAGGAEEGWNLLGELEMASGEARVIVSDESEGRAVVADAIRWRPAGRTAVAEEGTDE